MESTPITNLQDWTPRWLFSELFLIWKQFWLLFCGFLFLCNFLSLAFSGILCFSRSSFFKETVLIVSCNPLGNNRHVFTRKLTSNSFLYGNEAKKALKTGAETIFGEIYSQFQSSDEAKVLLNSLVVLDSHKYLNKASFYHPMNANRFSIELICTIVIRLCRFKKSNESQ